MSAAGEKRMEKLFDINEDGFSIRCKLYYNKDIHNLSDIVICTHGFGGFKNNKAIEKFAERICTKYKGYGVVCFDWPCHGDDARKKLVLGECLTYLENVIRFCKQEYKAERIYNYSTSFGAYLTMVYIMKNTNPFQKIALRSPAFRMHESLTRGLSEEDKTKLSKGKEILMGRERLIRIEKEFLDEVKENDITKYEFFDYADDILVIHGTKDEMIPIEYSETFSEENVIEMVTVLNADHRFSDPKTMDFAIQKIIEFFMPV